jgi:4a-hydroxytetrahydrobiopterin dehydratase
MDKSRASEKAELERDRMEGTTLEIQEGAGPLPANPLKLSPTAIEEALQGCEGWQLIGGACACSLIFPDFVTAFAFMSGAALISEQLGHHPEWSNTYNRVSIRLMTHDAGGVTEQDISWIRRVLPLQRGAKTLS